MVLGKRGHQASLFDSKRWFPLGRKQAKEESVVGTRTKGKEHLLNVRVQRAARTDQAPAPSFRLKRVCWLVLCRLGFGTKTAWGR
jgi:hypothetical protein